MPAVPAAIVTSDEIDPSWMTDVLHAAGVGIGRRLLGVERVAIGTGQMGDNVRYRLTWDAPGDAVPDAVVAKFPSPSPISRATAKQIGSYRNEVGFYRDIQPRVTIRSPRTFHVGWDDDSHDFVLLMEDAAPARQGDQLAGCSVRHAEQVVAESVGLHAPTWGRAQELAERHDWLALPSPERTAMMEFLIGHTHPGFLARYESLLSDEERRVGEAVIARYRSLVEQITAWADRHQAWCVTHGDYRLDNLLFDDAGAVTVVDWQTVGVGIGPVDVAYFCGAGLLPDEGGVHERRLVMDYAGQLRRSGVAIDDEAVWEGYVLGSASGYLMAVIASQIVERTERGDQMFVTMASRHAAQIERVGLLDVLAG